MTNSINKSLVSKKGKIILGLIIAVLLTIPIAFALATTSIQPLPIPIQHGPGSIQTPTQINIPTASHEVAVPQTQFKVHIAYAYVGPAPSNVSEYLDTATNTAMHLFTQYPSVVLLNITSIPAANFTDWDAAVEVYGIKIAADTGPAEYRAYFIGTNHIPSLSNDSQSTLIQYVPELYNASLYSNLAGNFKLNWDGNKSFLTNTLGSITSYTNSPKTSSGLFSAGKPNDISVSIYRIGCITIKNSSVTVFEDPPNTSPVDTVQLGNYESGFLHNELIPSAQLSKENLFHPIAHP